MRKRNLILCSSGVIIGIFIAVLIIINPLKKDIWDINADKFRNSSNILSGNMVIEDLSKFTPFQWDTLYSFKPYTMKEEIYKTIGYKWDDINETVSEDMNQIMFVKDSKVVCYLYGYSQNIKLAFNFGEYEGTYVKLKSDEKLSFKTTIDQNGTRYFDYIK